MRREVSGDARGEDVDTSGRDARAGEDEDRPIGENLNARFGAASASDDSDGDFMEELRRNVRDKRGVREPSARRRARGTSLSSQALVPDRRRDVPAPKSSLGEMLRRERDAHLRTRKKYEELGVHATAVLRQRDETREALEASTTRERTATARVDELTRRLDEERSMSEARLEDVRRSSSEWREAQIAEVSALREAAETRMREANEAASRVDECVAARVAHFEKRLGEAERDAAQRARDAIGRFGALASSTEVQATREAKALKARVETLEDELASANRERSNATHAATMAKRDMDEAIGQFESFRAELASARDIIHARDEALATTRRELKTIENARDDTQAKLHRLEIVNRDLDMKVSSLEEVLGDVGGHKRSVMILRARVTHLTAEIQSAKEIAADAKSMFTNEMRALEAQCKRDMQGALHHTEQYYESRLRASSEGVVAELRREVVNLEGEIAKLKRVHARELENALVSERAAISSASESSIRSSTQRTIEAEKAKAVAELSAREALERLESSTKEREAMEAALVAANEHVAALNAERTMYEQKVQRLKSELEESEANVRDLSELLNARKMSAGAEQEEASNRLKIESDSVHSLQKQLEDAKAEGLAAVKRAEDMAQLEIDALKRGLEMSAHRASSESEGRIAALEKDLAEALESRNIAREEAEDARAQLNRYEALTKLQDDAMSASKSQVKSLSQRLRSLESSMSGSPIPGSASPAASPTRSFFLTPGTFTPGSPVSRPAPTPISAIRSPRSPRPSSSRSMDSISPIKPSSPLFKGLGDDL
jgi:chromosome segregation ATPase